MDGDSENPAKLNGASHLFNCVYGHFQEFDRKVLNFPVEAVGGGEFYAGEEGGEKTYKTTFFSFIVFFVFISLSILF